MAAFQQQIQWSCAKCTFINKHFVMHCKLCNNPKPQNRRKYNNHFTKNNKRQHSTKEYNNYYQHQSNKSHNTHNAHNSQAIWSWCNHGNWKNFESITCKQIDDGIIYQWQNTNKHILSFPFTKGSYFSKPKNYNQYICKVVLNERRTQIINVYQENIVTKYRRSMRRTPPFHQTIKTQNNHKFINLNQDNIMSVVGQLTTNHHMVTITNNLMENVTNYKQQIASKHINIECNLKKCVCCKQICNILSNYSAFIALIDCNQDIVLQTFVYGDNYNNVKLLNDFHHLLIHHANELEDIYNILNKILYNGQGCDYQKCEIQKRNFRNRSQCINEKYLRAMYYNYDDHCIVTMQLLDRIHSYLMHTFDFGYKLTKNEREIDIDIKDDDDEVHINKDIIRIRQVLKYKHQRQQSLFGDKMHNKFTTTTPLTDNEKSVVIPEYDYGYRFYYHQKYEKSENRFDKAALFEITERQSIPGSNHGKTVGEWHIKPKHETFKDELLSNIICRLGLIQYNQLIQKANIHKLSNYAATLKCSRGDSATYYEMISGQDIGVYHIIAVLVYCNFDTLQHEFSKTFRKLEVNETDKQLKDRHSSFYWLARRLRECVECIGMELDENNLGMDCNMDLYHGVNTYRTFSSLTAYIKGPLSTSVEEAVANRFMANTGILLKLKLHKAGSVMKLNEGKDAMNTIIGFNCEPFSDYTNERERLFIGGIHPIKIISIIQANGDNYDRYISGLRKMTRYMSSGGLSLETFQVKITDESWKKQMEFRLLSHEIYRYYPNNKNAHEFMSCPEYFKQILHLECSNIKGMVFWSIKGFNNRIQDYFFKDKNGWIKLDVIMTVFPRVDFIGFAAMSLMSKDWSNVEKLNIFGSVLSMIKNKQRLPKTITVLTLATHRENVEKCIEKHSREFEQYKWGIHHRNSNRSIHEILQRQGVEKDNLQNAHETLWKDIDKLLHFLQLDVKNLLILEFKRD